MGLAGKAMNHVLLDVVQLIVLFVSELTSLRSLG